jgi:beta-glucanase (GH16 family)
MTAYVFHDDFNGPAGTPPDPSKWCYDLGGGGWGNGELQEYTDSPVNAFQDGRSHLVIRATQHGTPGTAGAGITYHSARIKTLGRFARLGGTFEARIKVDSRRGLWPAFWLMGQNITTAGWPACGEVDILEDYGYSTAQTSVHAPGSGGKLHSTHRDLPSDRDWHVYQMDWSAAGMTFSRDGRPYLDVASDQWPRLAWVFGPATPNNGGMFMLLNLAVGGAAGNPPAGTEFPADLLIDYIRVSGPALPA